MGMVIQTYCYRNYRNVGNFGAGFNIKIAGRNIMKCNECKVNMAQIPYIEHKKRIYKAYKREQKLKILLVCTNAMWVLGAVLTLITR